MESETSSMAHSVLNSGPSGPRPSGSGARAPSAVGKTLPGLAQLAEAIDTFQVTKLSTRLAEDPTSWSWNRHRDDEGGSTSRS